MRQTHFKNSYPAIPRRKGEWYLTDALALFLLLQLFQYLLLTFVSSPLLFGAGIGAGAVRGTGAAQGHGQG